jgi:hypothetical protein
MLSFLDALISIIIFYYHFPPFITLETRHAPCKKAQDRCRGHTLENSTNNGRQPEDDDSAAGRQNISFYVIYYYVVYQGCIDVHD